MASGIVIPPIDMPADTIGQVGRITFGPGERSLGGRTVDDAEHRRRYPNPGLIPSFVVPPGTLHDFLTGWFEDAEYQFGPHEFRGGTSRYAAVQDEA